MFIKTNVQKAKMTKSFLQKHKNVNSAGTARDTKVKPIAFKSSFKTEKSEKKIGHDRWPFLKGGGVPPPLWGLWAPTKRERESRRESKRERQRGSKRERE